MISPWENVRNQLDAMFDSDDEVTVSECKKVDDNVYQIDIWSTNISKVRALSKIMKNKHEFGNITLNIVFIEDDHWEDNIGELYRIAFAGNDIFHEVKKFAIGPDGSKANYALFTPGALKWYSDDISSPYGESISTIEDLAKRLFTTNIAKSHEEEMNPDTQIRISSD
jgi:hypothetical protein